MTEPPIDYYKRGTEDLVRKEQELMSRFVMQDLVAKARGVLSGLEAARPQDLTSERLTEDADRLRELAQEIETWRL